MKQKDAWCKMLQLHSALKQLFRQPRDHFHWKEHTQFARIKSFLDFVAYCCKYCNMLQRLIAGCNCRNRPLEQTELQENWMKRTFKNDYAEAQNWSEYHVVFYYTMLQACKNRMLERYNLRAVTSGELEYISGKDKQKYFRLSHSALGFRPSAWSPMQNTLT